VDYFWMELLRICCQRRKSNLCVLIKHCLFSVSACGLLLYHGWPNVNKLTFDYSLQNLRQRGTSQCTANANKFCTKAFPESCWFRMYILCGVDCKGAKFLETNKFTHSNIQTLTFTYQYKYRWMLLFGKYIKWFGWLLSIPLFSMFKIILHVTLHSQINIYTYK